MVTSSRGLCHGFEVDSSLELRYLREGRGQPLRVDVHDGGYEPQELDLVLEWSPRPDRPIPVRLYRHGDGGGHALWIGDTGWFFVDPAEGVILVPSEATPLRREERLWGMPSILAFLGKGDFPLHAAAVDVGGRAVLLGAPTRSGKTTLAGWFWHRGFRLLSEDLSRIHWEDGGWVFPGPAMLRLRRDVAARIDVTDVVEVGRDEERVHLALTGPRAADARPAPLAAIVLLHAGGETVEVDRVPPVEALPDLWALTYHLPDDDHERSLFSWLTDMAATVPVWRLRRPLRYETLDSVVERVVECVGS